MGGTGIDVYAKNGGRATVSITAEPGIQASSKGAYLVAKGEAARVQADVAGDIAVQNSSDNYSAGAEIFAIQGGEAELKCGGDLSIQSTRAEGVALQSWEGRAAASIEGNLLAIGQANRNGVTAIYISTVDGDVLVACHVGTVYARMDSN